MKAYYELVEFWDLLTLPFYFGLIYLLLYGIGKKLLLPDGGYLKIHLLALLLFYLIIGLVDFKIKLIPFFPDTGLFTRILETGVTPDNQSLGVRIGYKFLAIPIYWLSLTSIFNYFLFNVLFFQVGLILIAAAYIRIFKVTEVWFQRFFLSLSVFMPSIIIYSFTPLRESYFALALGLFFYGLSRPRLFNFFLILGFVLAAILRVQLVLYFSAVLGLKLLYDLPWKQTTKWLTVLVLFPVGFLVLNVISKNLLNIEISPASLSIFRNIQRINYFETGVTYPEVDWNSWLDLILAFPGLFFQFLLAPFPVLVFIPFWTKIAYFADGLYLLLILFFLVIGLKSLSTRGIWILFIVVYVAMSGFFEFHLLGAVRHRLPATLFLIALAAESLVFYLPRLRWFFRY